MNFLNWLLYHRKFINSAIMVLFLLFINNCGKRNEQDAAQSYFKMAFMEVCEDPEAPHAIKKALTYVDRAIQEEPKAEYYAFKATLLFKLHDFTQSEMCFQKALSSNHDLLLKSEILNNYACLLADKRDYRKAQELWEGLIADPNYQTPEVALVNMGKMYLAQRQFDQAQTFFKRAVQLCPSYLDAHFYCASTAYQLKDQSLAQQETSLVLSLEPQHTAALDLASRLGVALPETGAVLSGSAYKG